jgi:hypothetical protein
MDRRTFLGTLAGGLLAAPLAAEAQPAGKVYRIGVVAAGVNPRSAPFFQAFEQRLRELGWVGTESGRGFSDAQRLQRSFRDSG